MKAVTHSLAIIASLLVVAGCLPGGPTTAPSAPITAAPASPTAAAAIPTASPAPTADLEHPVGIIAIGHSGLTGEGTAGFQEGDTSASWATGTDPAVNSVYMRLTAALPTTEGLVANAARGGAPASALVGQARTALAQVPAPALAIIATFDNDIRCDGSNIAQVGQAISAGLAEIHAASPNTKILLVGQPGRPSAAFIEELVAHDPAVKGDLTWDDECTFYTADGELNRPGIKKLSEVIDAYEAEQARVCATVPNCATDGGVRRAYVDRLENFSPDWAHFNVQGQAAQAALIWPVVEALLGL